LILLERLTSDVNEFEGLRGKLKDKDLYIQSQSGKLIKVQTLADKSVSELNELRKKNSELKSENAKLGVKCKEQTTRILELREKNEKIKKEIETKVSSEFADFIEN
jgi:predicted RNase H-like nuclease (RuvC/YqgF family)